jgi:hypothetical protein
MDFDNNLDNSPPNTGAPFGRTSSSLFAHIIAEVVVVGGVSLYFYNKITHLENVVETLKTELEETKALLFHPKEGFGQPVEAYLPNPPITRINPLNRPNSATSLLRGHNHQFGSSAREGDGGWYPNFEENTRLSLVSQLSPPVVADTLAFGESKPAEGRFSGLRKQSGGGPKAAIEHSRVFGPMTGGSSAREGEEVKQFVTLNRPKAGAFTEMEQNCEGGVCKLKRVAISKVSTQREIGGNTSKVKTFTTKSPNPVLKSVTPSLSASFEGLWPDKDRREFEEVRPNVAEPENSLNKVLNDIDDE